ncbi:MAG: TlpA family protein disulfide reductase [Isosphaeraceae bacterium]
MCALAFIIFWILYLIFLGPRISVGDLERSGMRLPAAYDWTVRDLNDEPGQFSRFKGKTVFLNIWATWCGPCVMEMPSIARLAEDPRLQGKGIEFVCVSVDDSSDTVRRFLKDRSWRMTFLRAERLPGVFSTDGIPATFVIAPDGKIAAAQVGAEQWDNARVVAFLEKVSKIAPMPADR